jgi:hypothetical protein
MSIDLKNFFVLMGLKTQVLIFFAIFCYKIWKNYGQSFFEEEYKKTIDAECAREQELTALTKTLHDKQEEAVLNAERVDRIKKTFISWQDKAATRLALEIEQQRHQHEAYATQTRKKRIIIQHYAAARNALADVITQTRANLIETYASNSGAQSLEKTIKKIAEQAKVGKG